jgi:hypothetical protein
MVESSFEVSNAIGRSLKYLWAGLAGLIAIVGAGLAYLGPPMIWTRADAAAAVINGTSIGPENIKLGNSRMPCRGPRWDFTVFGTPLFTLNKYGFGYTVGATHEDWKTNGSGSVCRNIWAGEWVWVIDPPYDSFSSDRSPESRGLKREAGAR